MKHAFAFIATLIALLTTASPIRGQAADSIASLPALPDTLRADSSFVRSFDMLMLMMDERHRAATSISFYSSPDLNLGLLSGYRVYKASTLECTLKGMGAGMTAGMAAGAFGMMTGAWNERQAWYVAGAAAAVGALFGRAKSDDPEWNIKIKWDPDR